MNIIKSSHGIFKVGGYYEKFSNEQEKTKKLSENLDKSLIEVAELKRELEESAYQVCLGQCS